MTSKLLRNNNHEKKKFVNQVDYLFLWEKIALHSLQLFPHLQIAHGHTDTLSDVICVRLANLVRDGT